MRLRTVMTPVTATVITVTLLTPEERRRSTDAVAPAICATPNNSRKIAYQNSRLVSRCELGIITSGSILATTRFPHSDIQTRHA
jgi:hypothetical protein